MASRAPSKGVEQVAQSANQVARLVAEEDQRIARMHFSEEQELDEVGRAAAGLANSLQVQRAARRHLEEELGEGARELQERRAVDLLRERQSRHALETQLERLTDTKAGEVRAGLAEDASMQGESEKYAQLVCDEVCHLYKDIDQARQFRVDRSQALADGVQAKLGEVREAVHAERRIRLESQDTLLELFGQMSAKLDQELEQSRTEQSMSVDRVLKLMETVMPRITGGHGGSSNVNLEDLQESSDARQLSGAALGNLMKRRSSSSLIRRGSSFA